jgi:hypothetical protein
MPDLYEFGTASNLLDLNGDEYLLDREVFKKEPRTLAHFEDLPNGFPIVQMHEDIGWDWEFRVICMGATYAASRVLYKALYDLCLAAGTYDEFATGDPVNYIEQIADEPLPRTYRVVRGRAVENRKLTPSGWIEVALSFTTHLSDSGDP